MLALTRLDLILVAAVQLLGPLFYFLQNRRGRTGGGISLVKACWLVYLISLWYLLPALLLFKTQADWIYYSLFIFLLGVVLRAIIELVLCYITHNWRVLYGVLFDLLHLVTALVGVAFAYTTGQEQIVFGFAIIAVSILVELIFVRWFVQTTGGPAQGAYFVPDLPQFAWVHRWSLVLFGPQLLVCWIWLIYNATF